MPPENFGDVILQIVVLLFSVVFHEVSHGWVAERCGDPTARFMGRLTLNPVPHIDLWGSILLPGILVLTHSPILFGYAKPVPVDQRNLRRPRIDGILVAIAGPFSNVFLALVCAVLLGLEAPFLGMGHALSRLLVIGMGTNVMLALFNLLPVPPLDGSWLLEHTLRGAAYNAYRAVRPYGILILLGIMLFPPVAYYVMYIPRQFLLGQLMSVSQAIAGLVS